MEKSRRQQVNEALAINSLGSVEPEKEILEIFERYANHEIDYDELSRLVNENSSETLKRHGIINE